MTDRQSPSGDNSDAGCLAFGCALAFWLFVPLPFWLLGSGFAGQFVLLPDNWEPISVLWTVAFYAPLALMAFLTIEGLRRSTRRDRGD